MPVGAQGSSFKLFMLQEAVENVAPGGNWTQSPCFTFTLGADQELSADEILSANPNRDAADPFYGQISLAGDSRVPLDTVHIGKWLRMLFGAPVTTGTAPNYQHVFKSGSGALPSEAFEKAFPDIGSYERLTGVRANTMEVPISDAGGADVTFGLLGMQEATSSTSSAGSPATAAFTRFQRPSGEIRMNGNPLGLITGGTWRFSNNMTVVDNTVRADQVAEGIDFGQSTGSGNVEMRFKDYSMVDQAISGLPVSLDYTLTLNANTSIEFRYPRAFLQRQRRPVDSPRGISIAVPFIAGYDPVSACLMQVTLRNQVATY